ncbi:dTDP-4-dehydrorhamnose 3,5-epimerase family protein [Pseudodesulfovibrio sp. zrk46]|uniref:dTDP-4-dehydrorhamnose 3,5-epimerase family protein n=1 Tax=Pseudodesulfovibrio sp. zrk46 TaxID=2725288 RepID=UPI0014499A21|nr:dTDP-4-dehydrorhamnose 3,5-epimerase family protein [Pseudodesulfovibrio sp. zrk46]QJB55735.1 dTDP-4-keto-6-deoxy-D-glucose epimerase [Pseudodesulfovibrio sp. zrk46]
MEIQIKETQLEGVLEITPFVFEDFRGNYVETYNEKMYRDAGIDVTFIQDDISTSTKHVLRGIHGDQSTWKLVSCLLGKFYLVVVDCREDEPTFGKWQAFNMSDTTYKQILIPPRFGNAHLIMSDKAIFHYKQSTYYNPDGQFTYKHNHPEFDIFWPVENPILSKRDLDGSW